MRCKRILYSANDTVLNRQTYLNTEVQGSPVTYISECITKDHILYIAMHINGLVP